MQAGDSLLLGDCTQRPAEQCQRDCPLVCRQSDAALTPGEGDSGRQWGWERVPQRRLIGGLCQHRWRGAGRPDVLRLRHQLLDPPCPAILCERQPGGGQRGVGAVVPDDAPRLRPAARGRREQRQPEQAGCVVRIEAELQVHAVRRCVPARGG